MKLNIESIKNTNQWQDVKLPQFDIAQVAKNTDERPKWIHFGAGNIFRGFIARVNQTILDLWLEDTVIIAVETFDFDIIDKIYTPYDNLTMLVRLRSDGKMDKEVIDGV